MLYICYETVKYNSISMQMFRNKYWKTFRTTKAEGYVPYEYHCPFQKCVIS